MIKSGEQHLSYWVIFLLRLTCQQVRSTLWKCHLVEADPHLLKLTLQVRQRHTSDTGVFSYSRPWSHVWKYMLLQMNTWHCPRNQRPFRGPGDWPLPTPCTFNFLACFPCLCLFRGKSQFCNIIGIFFWQPNILSTIECDVQKRWTKSKKKWPPWQGWNGECLLRLCFWDGNRKLDGDIEQKHPSFLPKYLCLAISNLTVHSPPLPRGGMNSSL